MKIKYIIIILLFFLPMGNSMAYVLNCPGTVYPNTYQELTFSDCVNSSYIEVGPDYFWLSNMNFTLEGISSYFCDYNLSFFNDTFDNHTAAVLPYRFFEFNATYTNINPSVDAIIDMPTSNYLIDMYLDDTLNNNDIEQTGTTYNFDFNNDGNSHKFTFYIDGYLPSCPTNGASSYNSSTNTVNFTWSASTEPPGVDSYVVVRNNASYPSTPTDGYEVQNSSQLYYAATVTSVGYFTVWAYNNSGRYSSNTCKLDIPWGAVNITVYNESKPWQEIEPFGLLVTNASGTNTYYNGSCNSSHSLDVLTIPYGENTVFLVNATGYKDRTYYKDLVVNNYYKFSFYLPPIETEVDEGGGDEGGSGENFTTTQNYVIQVINEADNPIQGAKIVINRYNNYTGVYNEIASLITDGYGQSDTWLIPGNLYKVNVTADGYNSLTGQDWRPNYIVFSDDRYKIFQLEYEEPDYEGETNYDESITFEGNIAVTTLFVNFSDTSSETINTTIHVIEYNHTTGNYTIYHTNRTNSSYDFQFNTSVNTSNTYYVILHLNHSIFGYTTETVIIAGHPTAPGVTTEAGITSTTSFDTLFTYNYGTNPFGWSNTFGFFIMLGCLFAFGQRNSGISLIICGFLLFFLNYIIGLNVLGFTIPMLFVALGVLVQWSNHRKEEGIT